MRLVVFDMGGVLAQDVSVISPMCAKLGVSEGDFLRYVSGMSGVPADRHKAYEEGLLAAMQMGWISSQEFWHLFASRSGIRAEENYWDTLFHPTLNEKTRLFAEKLKARGFPVVCGTNVLDVHYDRHVNEGHYSVFDRVYASHLMGIIKPLQDFWKYILDSENRLLRNGPALTFEDMCFFDDNESNIAAASSLGVRAVLFRTAEQAEKDWERIA